MMQDHPFVKPLYSTPSDREVIYQELLDRIDAGAEFYLCGEIKKLLSDDFIFVFSVFPELWESKPPEILEAWKCQPVAWFFKNKVGMQKRKQCLLKAIQLCHSQETTKP